MMNYEITIGKRYSKYFGIDITAYCSKGNNLIQVEDMKNVNTGKFSNKGLEVSATGKPIDKLTLRASYSYLHTTLNDLTGAPKNQYFIGASWQALAKLKLNAELRGVGGLYVAKDVETQNYVLLNLKANYMIENAFELFVTLENITDAKYMINRGYDMPGFTAMGGFKVSI